jgi:hypothetical protein
LPSRPRSRAPGGEGGAGDRGGGRAGPAAQPNASMKVGVISPGACGSAALEQGPSCVRILARPARRSRRPSASG